MILDQNKVILDPWLEINAKLVKWRDMKMFRDRIAVSRIGWEAKMRFKKDSSLAYQYLEPTVIAF